MRIVKKQQVKRDTVGKRNYFLREGSFLYCSFIFFSDFIYLYTIMWEKEWATVLGEEVLKEHSGVAQENWKLHTAKADVNTQTGAEVNNMCLFPRITPFEDTPYTLPPAALAMNYCYWNFRNDFIHEGWVYFRGTSVSLLLKGNVTMFLERSYYF